MRPLRPHTQLRRSAQLPESARNVGVDEAKSVEGGHLVVHGVLLLLPAGHGKTLPSLSVPATDKVASIRSEKGDHQPVGGHQSRHLLHVPADPGIDYQHHHVLDPSPLILP